MKRTGINKKLLNTFLIQILIISALTVGGVLSAALITEEFLVNQALKREADYFWDRHREDPSASLPDTLNLLGYLAPNGDHSAIPTWLRNQPMGKSRTSHNQKNPIIYVSQQDNNTLYLVFNEQQVSQLSLFFGIVPLALVLLVLYGLAYLIYSQAKHAMSPIRKLANEMRHYDVNRAHTELDINTPQWNADEETYVLVDAINTFIHRVSELVERERNFTRYASHELRTPLSVIKGSVANLERQPPDANTTRHIARIKDTITDMEQLIDALLELARDSKHDQPTEDLQLNDLIELLVEKHTLQHPDSKVAIKVHHQGLLVTSCAQKLPSILINNLLKNAQTYTPQGRIDIIIDRDSFAVRDTGIGIEEKELTSIFSPFYRIDQQNGKGFGLGLAIVEKICKELDWSITVTSQSGAGTTFTVKVATPPI